MELEEVMAAAERLLWKDRMHEDYWSQDDHDECTLVAFVREELARRDKEAAERAMPITEEYCVRRGARHWEAGREYVFECGVRWSVPIGDCSTLRGGVYLDHSIDGARSIRELPTIKTQGQLDDLLNALKGDGAINALASPPNRTCVR